ncbi:hypothetical protein, partial [Mesorhizobium sp. M1A.F.Ca.IN.020.03.1.1]|uniref:hypothetical protein n=1 Tax=Mesorhizobium sp. M1A.F.Ca.IN.020.03.1.1 TaxID=2496764 RepID=UPI0019D0084B
MSIAGQAFRGKPFAGIVVAVGPGLGRIVVDYKLERKQSQRDLVLFLPDEILVVDHYSTKAWTDRYDYSGEGFSTEGLA